MKIEELELKAEKLLEEARLKATESKEKETEERAKKALEIAEAAEKVVREAKGLQETSEKLKTAETGELSEAAAKSAAKAAAKAEAKAEIRIIIAEKAVEAIVKEVAVKAKIEALEKKIKETKKALEAEGEGPKVIESDLQLDIEESEKKIELLREEETNAIKELTEAYEAAALAGSSNQQMPKVNQSSEYQSGSIKEQDSDDSSDSKSLSEESVSISSKHSDSIYSNETDQLEEEYMDELNVQEIKNQLDDLNGLLYPKEYSESDAHRVQKLIDSVKRIQEKLKNINYVLSEDIKLEKNFEKDAIVPLENFKKVIEKMQKKVDQSLKDIKGKDIVEVENKFKKLSNELKKDIEGQNNNFKKIKERDKAKELVDLLAEEKPFSIEEKPKSSFKNLFTSPSVWISLSVISLIVGASTGIGAVAFAGMIVGGVGVGLFIKKKFWDNTYKKWKLAKNLKKELKKFSSKDDVSLQEKNNIKTAKGINEEILKYANKFGGVEKARPDLMKLFQNIDSSVIKELRDSLINKDELSDKVQKNQSDRSQVSLKNFRTRIINGESFVETATNRASGDSNVQAWLNNPGHVTVESLILESKRPLNSGNEEGNESRSTRSNDLNHQDSESGPINEKSQKSDKRKFFKIGSAINLSKTWNCFGKRNYDRLNEEGFDSQLSSAQSSARSFRRTNSVI